jgi:hypothetical protein
MSITLQSPKRITEVFGVEPQAARAARTRCQDARGIGATWRIVRRDRHYPSAQYHRRRRHEDVKFARKAVQGRIILWKMVGSEFVAYVWRPHV